MSDTIMHIDYQKLHLHPENMRRHYARIEELAASIAEQGVLDPLTVVRESAGRLIVIDGNRRLKACQHLGDDAPPVPCRLVEMDRRQQFLTMATTFLQREDVDPIAEALHYRRLLDEEGETQGSLAHALGVSQAHIAGRLKLLELDAPIQDLIASGKLSKNYDLARALLGIPDADVRVALAQRLASRRITLKGGLRACRRVKERLEEQRADDEAAETISLNVYQRHGPAVGLGLSGHGNGDTLTVDDVTTLPMAVLRDEVRRICTQCDQYGRVQAAEPAWAVVVHAADATCETCGLQDVRGACRACPLPALLRRVALYQRVGTASKD